jgi:hypothetical protein
LGARELVVAREATGRYYGAKVLSHGATPEGADWRCAPTQQLRFVQLLRLCDIVSSCSLNDMGCGWGALRGFLGQRRQLHRIDYLGWDLCPEMIATAHRAWPRERRRFVVADSPPRVADYSVASGIFNVRLDVPLPDWEAFVAHCLAELRTCSRRGFAFNLMVPVPPGIDSPAELYRPPRDKWKGYCEDVLKASVTPVSGYGLHEQTLLVRY